MRHISSSGCGWVISNGGYTCSGLPPLDKVFQTTFPNHSSQIVSGRVIDQFDRLPQHIEGFRMMLSPILDLSKGTTELEIPELACRIDFDPFDDLPDTSEETYIKNVDLTGNTNTLRTGFLDLYNQVEDYKNQFYVTVDGSTVHMRSEDAYPTYTSSAYMGPGILEPMLNTQFNPIQIDMPPTPDLTIDAIIYSLVGLQGWRHAIDMRINTMLINAADTGMENLEAAKNMKGPCPNFTIIADTGYPFGLIKDFGSNGQIPKYSISDGDIAINGTPLHVAGKSGLDAPFYAYLDYQQNATGVDAKIVIANGPGSPVSGWKRVEIGSVLPIENNDPSVRSPFDPGNAYRLYKINQAACIDDLEYIYGGTGYVYLETKETGRRYKTDSLLTSLESYGNDGWRGVQAQAIVDYVAKHGGSGGNRMYPDYSALATAEGGALAGPGVGVTYVLPVSAGQKLGYMTDAPNNCFVRYAPAEGEVGDESEVEPFTLKEGAAAAEDQVAPVDGFVRFSILDDGMHAGVCVHFLVDDSDWDASLPVYRFGNFVPTYNGPFTVKMTTEEDQTTLVKKDIITVSCPICGGETPVAGYYYLNGTDRRDVPVKTLDNDSGKATIDIYAHVTGTTCIIDTSSSTGSTDAPPSYTVWLAHIGDKIRKQETDGQTTPIYFGGYVTQIHYGDIYVDGRWQ